LDCNHTYLYYVVKTGFGLLGSVNLDWVGSKLRQKPGELPEAYRWGQRLTTFLL